jgi:hypothetical protein
MKRFLGNVATAALALLLAGFAGEAVVRTLYKSETVLFPRYHAEYRYGPYRLRGIQPNAEFWHTSRDGSWRFVTNERGLRDSRNFPYRKPAGVLRVLSLGDSHTQGYEVRQEATFSAVLERYLASRGVSAEVLNAGVSGFSTAEALAYLENEGYRYQPDVVVLGWYANDFDDNLKAGLFGLDERGQLVERRHEHLPGVRLQSLIYRIGPLQWLSENSYFYSLLFNNVWAYFKQRLQKRAQFEHAVASDGEVSTYQLALASALIERMRAFCEARGIRLIVADIPRRVDRYRFDTSLPQAERVALRAGGVEVLEVRELLEELDGAADFHVPHGHRHISELTHALIAKELGRRIGLDARAPATAAAGGTF